MIGHDCRRPRVRVLDDPFCGVDFDGCLDEHGKVSWGQDLIDEFATYTEVVPCSLADRTADYYGARSIIPRNSR